jgi:hypothetical protein
MNILKARRILGNKIQFDFTDDNGISGVYVADQYDEAPMNKELWQWAQDNPNEVEPAQEVSEVSTEAEAENAANILIAQIQDAVDKQLAVLMSPRYVAKGMTDPEFEEKRIRSIKEWVEIDKQPGYPHEIEYPEVW